MELLNKGLGIQVNNESEKHKNITGKYRIVSEEQLVKGSTKQNWNMKQPMNQLQLINIHQTVEST